MISTALQTQLDRFGARRSRGRRPARIVVIGNVGNGNTGDEALLAVTLSTLVTSTDADPVVLSRNPGRVEQLHGVHAVPMTTRGALGALTRCDGVIVVGGGMFGPGLPRLVTLLPYLMLGAAVLGRDIAYVGIGVYPGMPDRTLAALRRSARLGRGATVRDQASARLLDPTQPPTCIGDLALYLETTSQHHAAAGEIVAAAGVAPTRPLLLLAPKAGTTVALTEQMLEASAAAARSWVERGGMVAALAFADQPDHGIPAAQSDTALAHVIADRSGGAIPVLGPNLHPAVAKAITGRASAVLGLRFHSVVFATANQVPATSFAWEPKTTAFLAEHQIPDLDGTPERAIAWVISHLSTQTVPNRRSCPDKADQ